MAKSPSKIKKYRKFIRINGKLESKVFSRKTDADLWYAEKLRSKERSRGGMEELLQPESLNDYAEGWLKKRLSHGKPRSSWNQDEARLRLYIKPAFGERTLEKVPTRDWDRFLNDLVDDDVIGPATRNRIRALLHKMYRDAIKDKRAYVNPLSDIPLLPEGEVWDYWEKKSECESYLHYAKEEGAIFFGVVNLCLNQGLRISEALAIDSSAISVPNNTLHIARIIEKCSGSVVNRTKSTRGKQVVKTRTLPMCDDVRVCLAAFLERRGEKSALLFSHADGTPLSQDEIRSAHERVCKKAGLRNIRIQDLRHTFASHYVMNGGTLVELQALLGHSSSQMTLKYAHLSSAHLATKSNVVSFAARLDRQHSVPMACEA